MKKNEPTNTQTNTADERTERCEECFFCLPDMIPDPNAEYKPGMAKRKVPGFRCHSCRPSTNGFPIVRKDQFCSLWTDRKSREQPLIFLLRPFYGMTTTSVDEIGQD
jgi:hypothetical protein